MVGHLSSLMIRRLRQKYHNCFLNQRSSSIHGFSKFWRENIISKCINTYCYTKATYSKSIITILQTAMASHAYTDCRISREMITHINHLGHGRFLEHLCPGKLGCAYSYKCPAKVVRKPHELNVLLILVRSLPRRTNDQNLCTKKKKKVPTFCRI
jgi:hypothetical protein